MLNTERALPIPLGFWKPANSSSEIKWIKLFDLLRCKICFPKKEKYDFSSHTCSAGGQRNSLVILAVTAEGRSDCLISMYLLFWS
jgi:hypothetical protein